MVKHHAKFGKLIDNSEPDIQNRIIELCKIKSLRIDRKRIKNTLSLNKLGTYEKPEERFNDTHDPDHLVAITGEKIQGNILTQESDNGYIEEINLSTPVNNGSSYCRYFSISDRNLKDITFGLYQYGVSVMIQDGSILFMEEILNNLKENQTFLKQYMEDGLRSYDLGNLIGASRDPHVASPIKSSIALKGNLSSYNPIAQKYSPEYVSQINNRYKDVASAPWVKPITEYLYALKALTNNLDNKTSKEYAQLISTAISPSTGNVEGLNAFIAAYDKLITSVQSLIGQDSSTRSGQGMMDYSAQREKKSYINGSVKFPSFIEQSQWFTNAPIDADDLKDSGVSYLSKKNSDNFRRVDSEEFTRRVQFENEKYFNSDSVNMNLTLDNVSVSDSLSRNDYSYFSPSFIKVGGKLQETTSLNYDNDIYKDLESSILTNKNKSALGDLVNDLGVTITKVTDPMPIPLILQPNTNNETLISVGTPDTMVRNVDLEIELEGGPAKIISPVVQQATSLLNLEIAKSAMNNYAVPNNSAINFDISKSVSKILNVSSTEAESVNNYVGLPNQIKSIVKASVESDQVRKDIFSGATKDFVNDINTSSLYEINWSLIQKVEVMVGFETNDVGQKMIKAERWETLTRELYETMGGELILCKMTPFSNDQFNIKYNNNIELPIYDGYFLLQVPSTIPRTVEPPFKQRVQTQLAAFYQEAAAVSSNFITTNLGVSNTYSSTGAVGGTQRKYSTGTVTTKLK